ncbi:cilia- and flagella-associated protein 61-like [Dendronephthya gigantea]|uniref:cilia- and flagella-associated protein 61-like n=1 Tax=Dendronephthya gigantea TaxID=151771 RepID=UPI00106A169D|nr:cilia- and flagella-associated protein 61-like [Dendronephthya gigantea]
MQNQADMEENQEVVLTARRTESIDAPAIEKLITSATFELFGRVDIVRVIEKANLAVSLVSSEDEVVASGAFFDYPNLSVDQAKWEKLFQESFESVKATPLNSLFLNFFTSKPDYVQGCASEILRTVFNTAPYIEYIFLVIPPSAQKDQPLEKLFNVVKCNENFNKEELNGTVYVCHRFEHSPKLHMRAATVEDHDDLIPIFDEQSETLINSYGDFFLNDLIEAEDDENKCLVADVNGTAVGFMSISTNVNVQLLSEKQSSLASGDSNSSQEKASVFCVELFCIDEKYEARSMDFLPAAFKLFPDKDYCVITMPHIVNEFPLVHEFTRVTPKVDATISHELYVFHRWGLLRTISVRPAVSDDLTGIENIVKDVSGSDYILRDIVQYNTARRDKDGQKLQVFVAECTNQVIGVAVLDIEFIRAHYAVEDFIYYNYHQREEHSHLYHFTLNPIFRHYTRHFLKEVLRLSHTSCLYYALYPKNVRPSLSGTKLYSVISCLSDLVPVRGRRQIIYQQDVLGINAPSEKVLKKEEYYALYHLNRKLTLEPKVVINARIVVVGASDTGISFLERFCFCPHLHFKNISLISPQGLPTDVGSNGDEMRPSSCCYTRENHAHMSLKTWISVVEDKMVGIDRVHKVISTLDGHQVPYDYLVLCCGEQYQIAIPSGADVNTLVTTAEVPRSRDQVYRGTLPDNVFTINSHQDVQAILQWMETSFARDEGKAVIYGASLSSHTFIQCALTCGIPGTRLVMVQPPSSLPSSFNNPDIERVVETSLQDAGVVLYKNYTLARWNHQEGSNLLNNASFTSSNKPLMLECQAFFCFQDEKVDYEAYKAINDSCLVYDGKLVVDKEFLTNDPAIRAAGPLTKFARRYHSESWTHANFNSKEVGKLLAESMMPLFDPTLQSSTITKDNEASLVPVFKEPKIFSAILPGGFHYLQVGKPTLNIHLDSLMAQPDYGNVLTTGAPGDEEKGYFRLHINQYNSIETITCLCKQKIDVGNLICLYGIHERYLNNLCQRYSEGLITDFYSYFKESWCVAMFHDRFKDLRAEIREILSSVKGHDLETMKDKVKKLIDEDLELSPADRDSLARSYMKSPAKTEIEKTLLNFITYNSAHLPMYAKPEMV